jgi:hypothetical protein
VKIYKNSWFDRFVRKNNIDDKDLIRSVERAKKGFIDADLGGFVIKQRIPRKGQSGSRGYRAIMLFKSDNKCFFVYGYSKNEKDNISRSEEKGFKELAELIDLLRKCWA